MVLCDIPPPLPETVTVKVPAVPEQERVDVPENPREMLPDDSEQARPDGETVAVKATVPVNPFNAETVIVEAADEPAMAVTLAGLAVMVKSLTVNDTVAE